MRLCVYDFYEVIYYFRMLKCYCDVAVHILYANADQLVFLKRQQSLQAAQFHSMVAFSDVKHLDTLREKLKTAQLVIVAGFLDVTDGAAIARFAAVRVGRC